MDLADARLISDGTPCLLSGTVGLMLTNGWQLRRNSTPMATSKRLPYGNNRRLSITLENESVVTSSWVTPRLQLLMHVLDEPTLVSRIT